MEGVLAREAAAKGMTRDQVYDGYAVGHLDAPLCRGASISPTWRSSSASDAARLVSGQVIAVDGHTENPDPKV